MDDFKKANMNEVDGMDYNCPRYCRRRKNDGNMLRRLARRRLRQELKNNKELELDVNSKSKKNSVNKLK